MQKSETIGELAKALALAQGEIKGAVKDSENPFFKSKYADLASVRDACQAALSKNGLAIVQVPGATISENATIVSVETLLMHSSGEWVSGDLSAIPVKDDPQGLGSCITYLRRYALSAYTGVAPEDDDGNAASRPFDNKAQQRPRPTAAPKPNAAERKALMDASVDICRLLKEAGDKPWGTKRLDEFTMEHFGVKADQLETPLLPELIKKLKLRLDGYQKGIKPDDPMEAERLAKLALITKEIPVDVIREEIKNSYNGKPLESLSLDALNALYESASVPF